MTKVVYTLVDHIERFIIKPRKMHNAYSFEHIAYISCITYKLYIARIRCKSESIVNVQAIFQNDI